VCHVEMEDVGDIFYLSSQINVNLGLLYGASWGLLKLLVVGVKAVKFYFEYGSEHPSKIHY
jgi:hypothetical protein